MERELNPITTDNWAERRDRNCWNQCIVQFVLYETFIEKYDTSQKQLQRIITGVAAIEGAVVKN